MQSFFTLGDDVVAFVTASTFQAFNRQQAMNRHRGSRLRSIDVRMGATKFSGPRKPIPPVLRSNKPGTWAYDTMSRRIRTDILARVFAENDYPPEVVDQLRGLEMELSKPESTPLSPLKEDGGPDISLWNNEILENSLTTGETWLSAPWAVAEFYFYRRIMTAVGYFHNFSDPFESQKDLGLRKAAQSMNSLAASVNAVSSTSQDSLDLQRLMLTSLWGNRMDLSIWPAGSVHASGQTHQMRDDISDVVQAGKAFLLSDDSKQLSEYVNSLPSLSRFDLIVDNAGFELFCDLCLADYLVKSRRAGVVHIHLKGHPTFVSDALSKDVLNTIEFLRHRSNSNGMSRLGERWASYIESEQWKLLDDLFWAQPTPFWKTPDRLKQDLEHSSLVVIKGDANYRRLLGDCSWPYDMPFGDITCYFPAPLCALRALKAEIGCGMDRNKFLPLSHKESDWLVSGRYGVLQFLDTNKVE